MLDTIIGRVLRAIPIICLALLLVLLFCNVIARTFSLSGVSWFDEIVQGLFAWMVFIGAAALWRENDHFQVLWLPDSLPPLPARILRIVTTLCAMAFLAAMTWFGIILTQKAKALTPILDLPTSLFYVAIPISGGIMMAYSLATLFKLLSKKDY